MNPLRALSNGTSYSLLTLNRFSRPVNFSMYLRLCFAGACAFFGIAALAVPATAADAPSYRNPALTVDERVADLLPRMTLEEKVGQMCQFVAPDDLRRHAMARTPQADPETATGYYSGISASDLARMTKEGLVGSFLNVTLEGETNTLQSLALQSRLGIPLIIGGDGIHGNGLVSGTTIYPTPLSLASSFDDALVEQVARQTAAEMRAHGANWTFSPNVDIARDARWGRTGETFGEDTYLVSRLGAAMVRGYQGKSLADPDSVLSCLKHLIAGSAPANGQNFAPMDVSERTLRSVYLPPYLESIKAGAGTLMAAHQELNGVPCHANEWLMEGLMRREAGFTGFIVSDWTDVVRLATVHHVAANMKEAVFQAVMAGLDMNMHGPEFAPALLELVREGRVPEARVDASVRRILRAKFQLGLFEHALADPVRRAQVVRSPAHQQLALEAARKSIVLLKNEGGLLPLDVRRHPRVLVTGPLAEGTAVLGDWVYEQPRENTISPLDGLKRVAPAGIAIRFAELGDTIRTTPPEKITAAVAMAREADVVVAVVGEKATRYKEGGDDKTSGENSDRSDIELFPDQLALVQALAATGKPVVVVLINSRPLAIEWVAEHIPAIVQAWEPGAQGGQAIAEVLFGVVNPSGRLPISIPRGVGHIETFYNHKPAQYYRPYVMGKSGPRFAFGHGLSYTTFAYSNLRVPARIAPGEEVKVTVDVTNTGPRAGDEIVLAYINDVVASVTVPVRELKAYQRISLAPGQTQTVTLGIKHEQLALFDLQMRPVVEPGDFDVFVGPLKARFTITP